MSRAPTGVWVVIVDPPIAILELVELQVVVQLVAIGVGIGLHF